MIPGPENPVANFRPGRMAGYVAVGLSVLLHGALAATVVFWPSDPVPYPIGEAIQVELVSIAPKSGAGASPEVEISGDTNPSGEGAARDMAPIPVMPPRPAPAATPDLTAQAAAHPEPRVEPPTELPGALPADIEPTMETTPAEPSEVLVAANPMVLPDSPVLPSPIKETAPMEQPETIVDQRPVFKPAPPRPYREPPPQLAKIFPPQRPVRAQLEFPQDLAGTIEQGQAKTPIKTTVSDPIPARGTANHVPSSESGDTAGTQTASFPSGNAGAPANDPGGLFVGPGFRLGTARNPLPRYPSIARRRGLEGRVIVRVLVGIDGTAQSARVAKSSTHGLLDAAAVNALRNWRFEPARQAGIPIVATVDVPIAFRLHD